MSNFHPLEVLISASMRGLPMIIEPIIYFEMSKYGSIYTYNIIIIQNNELMSYTYVLSACIYRA